MSYYTLPSTTCGASFGRSTTLKVPGHWNGADSYPLKISLHPYASSGGPGAVNLQIDQVMNFDDGAFLLTPDGVHTDGASKYWNYWTATGDDIDYIAGLITEVKGRFNVSWVALVGYSNGGFLAIQTAIAHPDLVNAVFTLAAAAGTNDPTAPAAYTIPHAHWHGDADATVLPAGDVNASSLPGSLAGHGGVGSTGYLATTGTVANSNSRNGGSGSLGSAGASFDFTTTAGNETSARAYSGTTSQTAVELWTGAGAGHSIAIASRQGTQMFTWLRSNHRAP